MRCNRRRPEALRAIAGEIFECLVDKLLVKVKDVAGTDSYVDKKQSVQGKWYATHARVKAGE